MAEAVAAARAEEQAKHQAAIIKLQAEVEAAKTKVQQAASHAAMSQEKVTKQRLARKITESKLHQKAKIDALLTLSDTQNDQFCIRAYCVRHTTSFEGDFNARMVAKRRKSLSEETVDADAGGSATQSTGLPYEDVYV